MRAGAADTDRTLAGGAVLRTGVARSASPYAQAVLNAVEALEGARFTLFDLHADAGVHVPLVMDLRLSGGRRPCHARNSLQ